MRIQVEPGSKEWIAWRNSVIGASDSPVLFKAGYKTQRKLWEEKVGLSEPVVNERMIKGTELEPMIRGKCSAFLNVALEPICLQSDEFPWMGCSIDGWAEDVFVEIKVNNAENHEIARSGNIPLGHCIQMNHQRLVEGKKKHAVYCSYNIAADDLVFVDLVPDHTILNQLPDRTHAFWCCVRDFSPPELDDDDWDEVYDEKVLENARLCKEWEVKERQAGEMKEFYRKAVESKLSERSAKIGPFKMERCERKGAIPYSQIQEVKQLDLEKYRKAPSIFWKLT